MPRIALEFCSNQINRMKIKFPLLLASIGISLASNLPEKQSNRHFYAEATTSATPEQVWNVWMDVAQWKNWDPGLKDAEMDHAMNMGSVGKVITLQDQKISFEITEFATGKSFKYKVKLPLGHFTVDHMVEERNGQTQLLHEVEFNGFSKFLLGGILGKGFREMLPEAVENVARTAEQR